MTRNTMEGWIPEEWGGKVVSKVQQFSAVEKLARPEPMNTDVKNVPRDAGVDTESVAKGAAYGEDLSTNDVVTLTARKIGKAIRLAEEDLQDTKMVGDIIDSKKTSWATSYSKFLDNAALGTSAAENGTTVLYTSLYKALKTTNAATGYTANDNVVVTVTGDSWNVTYDKLSQVFSRYEEGDYFDDANTVVIAHPYFKGAFRGVKDTQGDPIFVQGLAGTPDTLFGSPVSWTNGAKVSATATASPAATPAAGAAGTAGNPLLFVGNKDFLILGKRGGPESMVAPADSGVGFLTDETIIKMRSRRGFAVAHEKAWAVLEKIGA